jgi:hypothetical protein
MFFLEDIEEGANAAAGGENSGGEKLDAELDEGSAAEKQQQQQEE